MKPRLLLPLAGSCAAPAPATLLLVQPASRDACSAVGAGRGAGAVARSVAARSSARRVCFFSVNAVSAR